MRVHSGGTMIPPLDPFALQFDSIEIDPTRAPTAAAIEHALSFVAPTEDPLLTASAAAPDFATPGFHLLDDAGGRFTVDRDFGVITLTDDGVLATERGAVHAVRLRVVEASGASYELDMRLRLTGHVPQMVGAEDLAVLAGLGADEVAPPAVAALPHVAWTRFAATQGAFARTPLGSEHAAFGALLGADLSGLSARMVSLTLDAPPPAHAAAHAAWPV